MEINQLRYFREIARVGSISAAARKLRLTQPTLSIAMQKLEEKLGSVLFVRHRGGIVLTGAGSSLLAHTEEVFEVLDRAVATIGTLERGLVGQFVIACNESLGAYFLPQFLHQVLSEARDIQLSVRTTSSASALAAVVDREVHFGIVVNPQPHPDLVMLPLFSDAIDLFVLDESGLAADSPGSIPHECATTDLSEAHTRLCAGPLVYAVRVPQCVQMLELLSSSSVAPDYLLSCGDFELIRSIALAGVGVAMLPRRIAARDGCGRLKRLHDALPSIRDEIMLVYHADVPRTRAARFIKETLVQRARAMPSLGLDSRAQAP